MRLATMLLSDDKQERHPACNESSSKLPILSGDFWAWSKKEWPVKQKLKVLIINRASPDVN